ncbi:hypothetical protein [Clavibacter sp. Sh2088]|uniref:hypothetical protein n=1 Tax=Clavibacter sp. Sh2088 TaxID=3397676 RepID=UPI0039E1FA51
MMAMDESKHGARVFRTGLAVLVLLPLLLIPLAAASGDAPVIFFVQVVLAASWVAWSARRRRRARGDGQR